MAELSTKINAATPAATLAGMKLLGVDAGGYKQFTGALFQPYDDTLADLSGVATTPFGRGLLSLADIAESQTAFGLVIGTNVQAYSPLLAAISGLSDAAGVLTNDGAGNLSWEASSGGGSPFADAIEVQDSGDITHKAVLGAGSLVFHATDDGAGGRFTASLYPATLTANRNYALPDSSGVLLLGGQVNCITNDMLAGSIALSKLSTTGSASSSTFLRGDGAWTAIDLTTRVAKSGDTMTGLLQFSGTGHAGLRFNNLTTTQRDALTGSAGMAVWNTSTARLNVHNGTAWTDGFLRLNTNETTTGTLTLNPASDGTLLRVQVSSSDRFALVTTSTAGNLTWGHPSFFQWSTNNGALISSYSGAERCRITMAENAFNIQLRAGTSGNNGVYVTNSNLTAAYVAGDIRLNTTVGTFTLEPLARDALGGFTGAGHTMLVKGGNGQSSSTGAAGGALNLTGGNAGGSGNNASGGVSITAGTPTGTGARGAIAIASNSADLLGFYGVSAVARQLVPTGSTLDTVITALQTLGLFRQS